MYIESVSNSETSADDDGAEGYDHSVYAEGGDH
jgi:hypothetical protein